MIDRLANRIPELDGLRGIAVSMVLFWHFGGCLVDPSRSAWEQAIYSGTIGGRTGVDLFFVLSGFLIVGILLDNRNASNLFSVFYIRRAARILPPYFLLIAVYWLCYAATGPDAAFNANPSFFVQFGAQITFTYNWLLAAFNDIVARGFSVTWSVAVEEQFYVVAPLAIFLTPPRNVRTLIISVALISAFSRAVFGVLFPQYDMAAYVLTPLRLDCLCLGAYVATIWRNEREMAQLRAHSRKLSIALVALLAIFPLMIFAIHRDLTFHMSVWGHFYLAVLYAVLMLFVLLRINQTIPLLRTRVLQEAGRISYALYLFHSLYLSLFFNSFGRPERISNWHDFMIALGAFGASIATCYASFYLLEKPIRKSAHDRQYEVTPQPIRQMSAA